MAQRGLPLIALESRCRLRRSSHNESPRNTGSSRSSLPRAVPPRAPSPALSRQVSHLHLRSRFSRDEGDGGRLDPARPRPPWPVFNNPELRKSRMPDRLQILAADHRISDTAAVILDRAQVPFLNHVRDHESASRLQDPESLGENGSLVGAQVDDAVAQDHVRMSIRKREFLDRREDKRRIPDVVRHRSGRGACDHRWCHVDPGRVSRRADEATREEHVDSGAASEVDDGLAPAELRMPDRISTAQSELGFDRNSFELLRRIADRTTCVVPATSATVRRHRIPFPHLCTNFVLGCIHGIYYQSVVANIKYPPFLLLPDVGSQGPG